MKSFDEVLDILDTTTVTLKKYINKSDVERIVIDGVHYFEKEEVDRLLKNKICKVPFYIRIPEGYITSMEATKMLGLFKSTIFQDMDDIATLRIQRKLFISKKDVLQRLKNREELKLLENNSKWVRSASLGIVISNKIDFLVKQNQIAADKIRIFYKGKQRIRFLHSEIVDDILKNKLNRKGIMKIKNDIFVKDIYDFKDFSESIEKVINLEVVVKGYNYFSLDKVEEITGMKSNELIALIENGTLKKFVKEVDGHPAKPYKIYQNGVIKLLKFKRYVSAHDISEISGINYKTIIKFFNEVRKEQEDNIVVFCMRTYATIDIALRALHLYLVRKASHQKDLKKILDCRLGLIETDYEETFSMGKSYLYGQIERLKKSTNINKRTELARYINTIEAILDNLEKEAFDYDNDDIIQFALDWDLKSSYERKAYAFLNYIRESKNEKCKYSKQLGESIVEQFRVKNGNQCSKIYTEEQWYEYYKTLWNIDNHILWAFEYDRYSQVWLYCLLHLTITWRSKDIFNKIPNIPLEVIDVYDFQWFKDGNEFTLSMALKVLECVRFSLDGIVAYKNKMNLHFNVPLSLKITTAIALVINEIHRRKKAEDNIFYKLKKRHPERKDYSKVFHNRTSLIEFSNLKACRTLITLGFVNAVNTHGMAGVAYMMNKYARSHKESADKLTNTTEIYHQLTNTDGSATELAFHVFERDSFGYLYVRLLELCYKEEQLSILSQDEITEIVVDMQDEMSPTMIEQLCNGLMNPNELINIKLEEVMASQAVNKSKPEEIGLLSEQLRCILINRYKKIAGELFESDNNKAEEFIVSKCEAVDSIVRGYVSEGQKGRDIISEIINGDRNCYTQYSNCIYDENEVKEKCQHYPPSSCEGCLCNIPKISALYDISNKLNMLMDDMLANNSLGENELVRDTALLHNYLNILIEAKAQYENLDENILSSFVNTANVKHKIKLLREKNKLIYI